MGAYLPHLVILFDGSSEGCLFVWLAPVLRPFWGQGGVKLWTMSTVFVHSFSYTQSETPLSEILRGVSFLARLLGQPHPSRVRPRPLPRGRLVRELGDRLQDPRPQEAVTARQGSRDVALALPAARQRLP